jgi:hypothetical protein
LVLLANGWEQGSDHKSLFHNLFNFEKLLLWSEGCVDDLKKLRSVSGAILSAFFCDKLPYAAAQYGWVGRIYVLVLSKRKTGGAAA